MEFMMEIQFQMNSDGIRNWRSLGVGATGYATRCADVEHSYAHSGLDSEKEDLEQRESEYFSIVVSRLSLFEASSPSLGHIDFSFFAYKDARFSSQPF